MKTPVGRLKAAYDSWRTAGASYQVLDIVSKGCKLSFKDLPEPVVLQNYQSAGDIPVFVNNEIVCTSEVSHVPSIVNPLTMPYYKIGKPRLVLGCRHINPHLFKCRCYFEQQSVARGWGREWGLSEVDDFLFTFDLESVHCHLMILESHRTYLGFQLAPKEVTRYFVFSVLPFGISTAGYIFTKVMRVIVKHWRAKGLEGYKAIGYKAKSNVFFRIWVSSDGK